MLRLAPWMHEDSTKNYILSAKGEGAGVGVSTPVGEGYIEGLPL